MQRGTEHSLFLQGTHFFLAQRAGLKPTFVKTQKHTISGGRAQELASEVVSSIPWKKIHIHVSIHMDLLLFRTWRFQCNYWLCGVPASWVGV